LALFLTGSLSHQLLSPWAARVMTPALRSGIFAATLLGLIGWQHLPMREGVIEIALFLGFATTLPFLFAYQNASRLDQSVGDLSYPIYINHMLTLNFCKFSLQKLGLMDTTAAAVVNLVMPVLVAIALDLALIRPLERWRQRLRRMDDEQRRDLF